MRWRLFAIYVTGTVMLLILCISDFFIGDGRAKELMIRLLLCFLWPFAALSSRGRDLLFKYGRGL